VVLLGAGGRSRRLPSSEELTLTFSVAAMKAPRSSGPMLDHAPENYQMSHAEYASKPLPVFMKLAVMLRNIPAMQFVFAKFAALLRSGKASGKSIISKFLAEAPNVNRNTVDHVAILKSSRDLTIATKSNDDQPGREKLIRRRWAETGIKMWNPDVHGAGHAALNIQGRAELLPVKPGETLPGYDTLEFKMVRSYVNGHALNHIVCEGVVVDPPKRRK
jgi:hypothetical protein